SYPITLIAGSDSNYDITHVDGTLTVSKASLVATADDKAKVYGAANPALTISYTGFVNGDSASTLDLAPVPSTTATTASAVGTYPITLTAGSDNNYEITNVDGTLTVSKAALVTRADDQTKIYGSA